MAGYQEVVLTIFLSNQDCPVILVLVTKINAVLDPRSLYSRTSKNVNRSASFLIKRFVQVEEITRVSSERQNIQSVNNFYPHHADRWKKCCNRSFQNEELSVPAGFLQFGLIFEQSQVLFSSDFSPNGSARTCTAHTLLNSFKGCDHDSL